MTTTELLRLERGALAPAITRRVILRVAGERPLSLPEANGFTHTLHGNKRGHSDYLVAVTDGKYIIDFPETMFDEAVTRVDNALLDSFTPADIVEARVERVPHSLTSLETADAWVQMDEVTPAAEAVVAEHREQRVGQELLRLAFEVA